MPEDPSLIEACPSCAALVDVSEQGIFALAHCPMCGTAMRVRHLLNHFSLEEVVGVGGMGTVYKAMDTKLNRYIAIKLLKPEFGLDAELIQKLEREARITASINHPNVVKVYSFSSALGQYYLAMELVEKGSLDDLMQIQNRIAEVQVLNVGMQIALGLDAAYKRGLIHSDVKPGNILFADAHTSKIVDFGLAELMEEEAEKKGEIWGTPYYVSPERLNHEPEDFRSDLYSLGGTLFHALAGRPPFEAENASLVALKHVRSKAVSLQAFAPDISSETAYVINRMLKKNPDERYESYTELVEHLTYAKSKIEERSAAPFRKKERVVVEGDKLKATLGWLTLLAILVVVGLLAFAVMNWERIFAPPSQDEEGDSTASAVQTVTAATANQRFLDARKMFSGGQHQAALLEFKAIRESGPLPQPLKNWVTLFEGSALLALGKNEESTELFSAMARESLFSMDPSHRVLANFFVETARLLANKEPVGSATARMYSTSNVEAFSVYLFALKNYQLGWMEDAAPLLETFLESKPEESWEWISEFKMSARSMLTEIEPVFKVSQVIDNAATAKSLDEARVKLQETEKLLAGKARMKPALDRLRTRLDRSMDRLKPDPTPTPAPTPDAKVLQESAQKSKLEQEAWAKLQTSTLPLLTRWEFEKAVEDLSAFKAESPAVLEAAEGLQAKAKALLQFRERLIRAVNTSKYPKEFQTKSGAKLPPGASKADRIGMEVPVQYGTLPARWVDIPPATLGEIAAHYRELESDPARKIEWQWLTGVYLHHAGLPEQARELLLAASAENADYREQLEYFFTQ